MLNCSPQALEKFLSELKALDYTGYAEQYPPFGAWQKSDFSRKSLTALWRASLRKTAEAGIYVHIPFCRVKCDFCFLPVIATGKNEAAIRKSFSSYLTLLESEAALVSGAFSACRIKTLYIGGGTPSLMTPGEITRLFKVLRSRFTLAKDAQVATEIHPETAGFPVLETFRANGVNWLSIGAQSLSREVLSRARRTQDLAAVMLAYKNARRAGISGINIDLICGLPGQTRRGFLRDVSAIAGLRPDEIHLNTFIVTPYTLYGRRGGKPQKQAETERLKDEGFRLLASRGYKKHHDSAGLTGTSHNFQTSALADKTSVLGLGPGAVSHAWGIARYINHVSWGKYSARLSKDLPPAERGCLLTRTDEMRYYALEYLSHEPWELDLGKFRKTFGETFHAAFARELKILQNGGVRERGGKLIADRTHWNLLRGALYERQVLLELAGRRRRA